MIGRSLVLCLCLAFALACLGVTGCAPSVSSETPVLIGGGGAPPSTSAPTADVPTIDSPLPPSTTVPQADLPEAAGE